MKKLLVVFRERTRIIHAVLFLVMILSSLALYYLANAGYHPAMMFFLALVVLANLAAAAL